MGSLRSSSADLENPARRMIRPVPKNLGTRRIQAINYHELDLLMTSYER